MLPVAFHCLATRAALLRRAAHASEDATCATALRDRRNEGRDLLRLRVESGNKDVAASEWDSVLLIAAGCDPYALVDAAVVEAACLSGGCRLSSAAEVAATSAAAACPRSSAEGPYQGVRRQCKGARSQAAARLCRCLWLVHLGRILLPRLCGR